MRKTPWMAVAAALLVMSGCGASSTPKTTSQSSGGDIHVASTSLGDVLVDGHGMTLYMLTADSPGHSSCAGSCLAYWPAVAPPSSTSLPGVTGTVGHTTTPDGKPIATVGGWPLYTYVADKAPGDVGGEGVKSFGGVWYALAPDGTPVKSAGSTGGNAGY
jgi:predicted lipoprotein with Yx(FWY)xxD motif